MEITDEMIWSFIDGDLSEEDAEKVALAIAEDETISNMYLELLETHDQFANFFQRRQSEQGAKSFSTVLGKLKNSKN